MNGKRKRESVIAAILLAAAAMGLPTHEARGNETDQFTLPPREQFADVGPCFSRDTYYRLANLVEKTNNRIAEALLVQDEHERETRIEALRSPAHLADALRESYPPGFFDMMNVEDELRSDEMRKLFPGKITAYRTVNWIYRDVLLPVDPRKAVLLFQSSTIRMYGVMVGVDKLGHFHDLGHFYFKDYLNGRALGLDEAHALKRTIGTYTRGLISEDAMIGAWATGVAANGDLAANYAGYKFYRNLTEAVRLPGGMVEPLIIRKGHFLALNKHVGPDTDFMKPFVTNHMNEALNPSRFEWSMHGVINARLRRQAKEILAFYADEKGNPRPREWFEKTMEELSTYGGEDYGHTKIDPKVTIAGQCFGDEAVLAKSPEKSGEKPAEKSAAAAPAHPAAPPPAPSAAPVASSAQKPTAPSAQGNTP
ncbi:MAG: hypothetical protein NTW19_08245 [Planctomycetota bacterium]|nr:hypothetical protein [Planctomycetota bacterium]